MSPASGSRGLHPELYDVAGYAAWERNKVASAAGFPGVCNLGFTMPPRSGSRGSHPELYDVAGFAARKRSTQDGRGRVWGRELGPLVPISINTARPLAETKFEISNPKSESLSAPESVRGA